MARLFVTLTFKSVDEILWCYHLNETSFAELLYDTPYSLNLKQISLTIFMSKRVK